MMGLEGYLLLIIIAVVIAAINLYVNRGSKKDRTGD